MYMCIAVYLYIVSTYNMYNGIEVDIQYVYK